jgi:hypothetical protein
MALISCCVELNAMLTPHSIIPGDACFAYRRLKMGFMLAYMLRWPMLAAGLDNGP